jgi:hypothetical protein
VCIDSAVHVIALKYLLQSIHPPAAGALKAAAAAVAAATTSKDVVGPPSPKADPEERTVTHVSDARSGWMKRQAATGFMTISKKWKENWFSLKVCSISDNNAVGMQCFNASVSFLGRHFDVFRERYDAAAR